MNIKTKLLLILIALAIMDVLIPIPITTVVLIYVLSQKPPWFIDTVHQVYNSGEGGPNLS